MYTKQLSITRIIYLYTVQCAQYTLHSSVQCTQFITRIIYLYRVHCTLYSVQYTQHSSVYCVVYTKQLNITHIIYNLSVYSHSSVQCSLYTWKTSLLSFSGSKVVNIRGTLMASGFGLIIYCSQSSYGTVASYSFFCQKHVCQGIATQ